MGRAFLSSYAGIGTADWKHRSLAKFCDLGFRANQNIPLNYQNSQLLISRIIGQVSSLIGNVVAGSKIRDCGRIVGKPESRWQSSGSKTNPFWKIQADRPTGNSLLCCGSERLKLDVTFMSAGLSSSVLMGGAVCPAETDPHRMFVSKPGEEKIKTRLMLSVPMFLRLTQV